VSPWRFLPIAQGQGASHGRFIKEPLSLLKIVSLALVVLGVIRLNLSGVEH
jgi:hypothetical protein